MSPLWEWVLAVMGAVGMNAASEGCFSLPHRAKLLVVRSLLCVQT